MRRDSTDAEAVTVAARGTSNSEPTRQRLRTAATQVLGTEGIAGLSARVIADRAGVNQALIFYHFGSVGQLVDVACRNAADASVEDYRSLLANVNSFVELLALGRQLHDQERAIGNVAIMAQLMAGGQQDEQLAATARYCLTRWHVEIETTVRRLLAGSPLALVAEPAAVARAVSAGFLGLELYEGIDPEGAHQALDSIERLGALVEVIDELGPVARRALRAKLRRRREHPSRPVVPDPHR
jgi:AcrR family transcriptional regulator